MLLKTVCELFTRRNTPQICCGDAGGESNFSRSEAEGILRSLLRGSLLAAFMAAAAAMPAAALTLPPENPSAKSYDLKLNYDNGILELSEITLVELSAPARLIQPENGWRSEVVSASGEVFDSFRFTVPAIACKDEAAAGRLEGGCLSQARADFSLAVPYFPQGALINIYDPEGNFMLAASTVSFADLCGDGVCEANENNAVCAKDCRSGIRDGVCDKVADGTCDPDCGSDKDPDCGSDFGGSSANLLALVLLAAIVLAGTAVWQGRKNQR